MSSRQQRRAAAALQRQRLNQGKELQVFKTHIFFHDIDPALVDVAKEKGVQSAEIYLRLAEFLRRRVDEVFPDGKVDQFAPVFYIAVSEGEAPPFFRGISHPNPAEIGLAIKQCKSVASGHVLLMTRAHPQHGFGDGVSIRFVHDSMFPQLFFREKDGTWLYFDPLVETNEEGMLVLPSTGITWVRRKTAEDAS